MLFGKLLGRELSQGAVGSDVIVFMAPRLDGVASVLEGQEPVHVQAVIAERAVEALDEGILRRLSGLDEVELDATRVGPSIERSAPEL